MTAQTILPANSASSGSFDVANSCRFDGSSASMKIEHDSNMNLLLMTWSGWIKRSGLGAVQSIFAGDNTTGSTGTLYFDANDKLNFQNVSGNADKGLKITNRVFRDPSAWYHIVWAWDSANSTAADRIKIYVNGVRETSFSSSTNPDADEPSQLGEADVATLIGTYVGEDSRFWNGYMAEVVLIDGAALAPTSFGEFDDSGIWKPKDVSGLTFGTLGFYLDFKASGNLGNDANGGTDLTESNLAAVDQSTDTCTNNFATMNPLDNFYQATAFTEGNLKLVYTSGNRTWNTANVALSSGKWYCEILKGETNNDKIGIHYKLSAGLTDRADNDSGAWTYLGGKNADDGGVKTGGTTITYTIDPSDSGDIVGLYLDLDNNKVYFGVNGTVAHSGVGIDIPAVSTLENGQYYIFGGSSSASETMTHTWNFGSPAVALSSGVTDANGFGNFEYTPSGTFDSASKDFLAICTKNLAGDS